MVTLQNNVDSYIDDIIKREVLTITSVTSEKFIVTLNRSIILGGLLIGLKFFQNSIRWKAFFKENTTDEVKTNKQIKEEIFNSKNEDKYTNKQINVPRPRVGLCSNLKPLSKNKTTSVASK